MLEQIIQLVTILFLLSMVCERIADFFKHYLCGSDFFGIGDTITKFPGDDIKEQARAYRILKINVWCGIATAAILKADMIKILNDIENAGKTLGWSNISEYASGKDYWYQSSDYFFLIPGIVVTGCFISFGSKFWHDLLDILYQVKNTKRLLADPETYKIDNISTLDKRITLYQSDFIQGAYLTAKQELFAYPNVKAVSLRYNENGYYFEVSLQKADNSMPTSYIYNPQEGGAVTIPISIVVLGDDEIVPHTINLGNKISNKIDLEKWGTLGCIVIKKGASVNKPYILTCYHNVVVPGSHFIFTPGSIDAASPDMSGTIGKVEFAVRDNEADAALIPINSDQVKHIINNLPGGLGHPLKERKLTNKDVENKIFASMYGASSGSNAGTLVSVHTQVKVKYSDGEHAFTNLIAISRNGKAISQPGDSGSCILDENNSLLGILVAGNKNTSYAIPANTLFSKLNISLIEP